MTLSRRAFLGAAGGAALGFVGLRELLIDRHADKRSPGYGPLERDPKGVFDLPRGFTYQLVSATGESMDDGLLVPGAHDGMAAFAGPGGRTILVRNHEVNPTQEVIGAFGLGSELLGRIDRARLYDEGVGSSPGLGGTATLVYDGRARRLERHFLSLGGTLRNCAGGPTPWGSWLTCEETVLRVRDRTDLAKDHGYVFEVPATAEARLHKAEPLRAMGRFNHEAAAVDARSGCVYLTEDRGGPPRIGWTYYGLGLLYRFVPTKPGELARGGKLQALRIRDRHGMDTTNWDETLIVPGQPVAVDWVDLENPESPEDDLRYQGRSKGAAAFTRGEGIWAADGSVFFCCTDGGRKSKGQVWRYRPSPEEGTPGEARSPGLLELFVEPNASSVLENCDNLTGTPWGDLILCEDGPGGNYLQGVTPAGKVYELGRNAMNMIELAGVALAPDRTALFVNIQHPGVTVAIFPPGPFWEPPSATA